MLTSCLSVVPIDNVDPGVTLVAAVVVVEAMTPFCKKKIYIM